MSKKDLYVVKRSGQKELLDINKLHKVVEKACENVSSVSASEVELASQIKFFDGMKTSEIQETLIKAATELTTEDNPNYQYVAGNLSNFHLRKEVYGQKEPLSLYDQILKGVHDKMYTPELLEWYSKEEIDTIDTFIDHSKDFEMTGAAIQQFIDKYLVRNRYTKKYYETPQFSYILIAMVGFHSYKDKERLKAVKDFYELISGGVVSPPTPILAKLRTPTKQFSSCVLIESGDNLESITSAGTAIVKYVAKSAGIGINASAIRSKGSSVRNGEATSTGMIPFLKKFAGDVKSVSQGGIRNASATINYLIWHHEIEDLLVLKNNKGTEETRIRNMDYCVSICGLFYERYLKNEDMTLFSPHEVPDLLEAFYSDQNKFKELYEKYERSTKVKKIKVSTRHILNSLMVERKETGRVYILNVDNANTHGPLKPDLAPIKMTNLCAEILQNTAPMGQDDSLIALCTLASINLGKINSPEDFEKPCKYAVRFLDNILSYQDYLLPESERHTRYYRPLGIGLTNMAYWFAKNGLSYTGDQKTLDTVDEYLEAYQYYLVKASCDLAKELGPCEKYENTKYSDGLVCIDWYKKTLDQLVKPSVRMDWKTLKEDLKTYGIRNATLSAIMPCESSVLTINSTNGIEPIRALVVKKKSKEGIIKQVAPSVNRLKNKYELLWDLGSAEGYIKIVAIMQKYIDQSISSNTTYSPKFYENNEVPMSVLMKDLLTAYKYSLKTLYYCNTSPNEDDENQKEEKCSGGGCTL